MATQENIIRKGNRIYLRIVLNAKWRWFYYDANSAPLGSGAMGIVYLGYSCDDGMPVAIKMVKPEYAEIPSIRKRAHTEAAMMYRHHNLVEMLGCCEAHPSKGHIYIISKFVYGINIDKFIDNNLKSLPVEMRWRKVCNMIFPVMDALEYIHSYGVVHLDIKPSNIMVENGNNVRLMDLGISNTAEALMHDAAKGFIGTPKYAAPEQFGGQSSSDIVNHITDIYCLGITIYELLTGRNPFKANRLREGVEFRQKRTLPYQPGIPNAVIDVLRKATAFEQGARFRSVSEFKKALQDAMNRKSTNRWPLIIGVSSVIVLLSIIILLIIWNR